MTKPGRMYKNYEVHPQQSNGPSHLFVDVETREIWAWYGQDPENFPFGEAVKIHCLLPPKATPPKTMHYPTVPWIELHDNYYVGADSSYP
jgi:hypothetical protein